MKKLELLVIMVLFLVLASCASAEQNDAVSTVVVSNTVELSVPVETGTTTSTVEPVIVPTSTVVPTLVYGSDWKKWPIIPEAISPAMKLLYQEGIKEGNDIHRFSKIGDCQNVPGYFLARFDIEGGYLLPSDQQYLNETVVWYAESWKRFPPSVHGGQNIVGVQLKNPLIKYDNNGQDQCKKGESYLDCEIRLWNPSVVVISFEELWTGETDVYGQNMEKLVLYLLDKKIVPILAMTAINEKANNGISQLAAKYQLPVWNLWSALQPLSGHGIWDGFHLTIWGDIFDFTVNDKSGWHMRNLTALQAIDVVRRGLEDR
ncbi:MAG: hypothetical protein ACD_61C00037G0001 [uncultured bacterium]|nr:MAG: hypothetical protein ACD_61C00037G0001 [uncultured bacterium]